MTEDEAKELLRIRYSKPGFNFNPIYERHSSLCIDFKFEHEAGRFNHTQLDWDCLDGESIRYLLSKHFDLFGLIDAGLAIDKTKTYK